MPVSPTGRLVFRLLGIEVFGVDIAAGANHTVARLSDGSVIAWG